MAHSTLPSKNEDTFCLNHNKALTIDPVFEYLVSVHSLSLSSGNRSTYLRDLVDIQ